MTERRPLMDGEVYAPVDDLESQEGYEDPKVQRMIRHGFIRKVYGIVACQLLLSTAIGAYFTLSETATKWIMTTGFPLLVVALVMTIVLTLVMACIPSATQSYPTNYVLLALYTLFMSVGLGATCGAVSLKSGGHIVFEALICTSVIVVGLTAFAFQTTYDFTSWAGALGFILMGMVTFGLVRLFFPKSPVVEAIFAAIMALVFCVYLVIDTQMIIGSGKIKLDEDQYIMAALMLYTDIINLFLNLLQLLSQARGD